MSNSLHTALEMLGGFKTEAGIGFNMQHDVLRKEYTSKRV